MTIQCKECENTTVWNEDAGSLICTSCGSLADPSQSVLTDQLDLSSSSQPSTLRSTFNWHLTGESKQAAWTRNTLSIHAFIKSLASSLSVSGLAPRASTLFDQAMGTGHFRWGTKAKLVAGACLSVALRESKLPESLRDIAILLELDHVKLTRTLASVANALHLSLVPNQPSEYLATLQMHLVSALQVSGEPSDLPPAARAELKCIPIQAAVETARSLSGLLPHFYKQGFIQLPPASAACAILVLCLEAEARTSLSRLGDIATFFATRCHIGKGLVMNHYKLLQDEVAKWIEELEWLRPYTKTGIRAKVSKRLIVARGLKEVISWKDEIWKKKLEDARPVVPKDLSDDQDLNEGLDVQCQIDDFDVKLQIRPFKKRRLNSHLRNATQFLVEPLHTPIPTSMVPFSNDRDLPASGSQVKTDFLPLTSYLLSVPNSVVTSQRLPTRLQILSVARGGEAAILDEELFAPGEFEAIQRSTQERTDLEQIWRSDGTWECMEGDRREEKRHLRRRRDKGTQMESARINREALALFMDNMGLESEKSEFIGLEYAFEDGDEKEDEENPELSAYPGLDGSKVPQPGDEEVVDDWRPLSP
ncbi:hypothetical protein K435DRAFT_726353 [Dendrothele bispora CBS 962.96]|uniref:TFIIB-type domain-containing protein n=1 Tax=Dendrothele bispora (strain CBS 962.96) TaxID=1314807 RepID=A0A4S8LT12_DENBC|nr:hypothetical protein K435DRAFT_726353 [Dendrothele bispora CBS 962.96]